MINFYSIVEKLVEKCSESAIDVIRSVDEDGNTPLHLACCHGYEEVALYLINNQADIGARYIASCMCILYSSIIIYTLHNQYYVAITDTSILTTTQS